MKKSKKYIGSLLLSVALLNGCALIPQQFAPGNDINDNHIEGVDFKYDIQGEDGSYLGNDLGEYENDSV